jgi:hypothetical protein
MGLSLGCFFLCCRAVHLSSYRTYRRAAMANMGELERKRWRRRH